MLSRVRITGIGFRADRIRSRILGRVPLRFLPRSCTRFVPIDSASSVAPNCASCLTNHLPGPTGILPVPPPTAHSGGVADRPDLHDRSRFRFLICSCAMSVSERCGGSEKTRGNALHRSFADPQQFQKSATRIFRVHHERLYIIKAEEFSHGVHPGPGWCVSVRSSRIFLHRPVLFGASPVPSAAEQKRIHRNDRNAPGRSSVVYVAVELPVGCRC